MTGARLLHYTDRSLLELVNTHDDEHNYNITQSPYYTDREMIDLLENKKTFTVMSLNCQSVASKFDELKFFIDEMMTHNCYVDVINLQESWPGGSSYYTDFTIPGYDLYMQPYTCTPYGGLITCIKFPLKVTQLKTVYQRSKFWEAMFFCNRKYEQAFNNWQHLQTTWRIN